MGENLLDHLGILNADDDSHCITAGSAGLYVDTENSFQAPHLRHLASVLDGRLFPVAQRTHRERGVSGRLERIRRRRSGRRLADELDEIALHCASLPILDTRDAEEILGYDEHGLPS